MGERCDELTESEFGDCTAKSMSFWDHFLVTLFKQGLMMVHFLA